MISEHTNYAVVQVDGKTGKHATHLGAQGHERVQNKRVRSLLFWFGGTRHGLQGLSESTITVENRLWTNGHRRQFWTNDLLPERYCMAITLHAPLRRLS
jgi:hypothetical protein